MAEGEPIKKDPQSDQIIQAGHERYQRFLEERRKKVAQAKQADPEKEAFDIDVFGGMYNLRGFDGKLRLTPGVVEEYEAEYYLKTPKIKSMQDFAKHKTNLDRQR